MADKINTEAGHVRLTGRLICRSARDVALVQAHLPEHLHLTRAEPGCVSFNVVQSDDPLIWHVEECFLDKAAFEFHQKRTRASSWWSATAGIPRDYDLSGLE
ncbi:antibiotic biosynthesis monooxygenase [Rhodobacteraceae bacterium 2376]|uniref:Antibiotic biosynthesis monooxygenase n=1 Tax=Rhabdonatronobacter sediminivivens TaxID=2743469 RepID=A0A7Z0HVV6_9RHOB|nr:antibiotic biosynthesis monooxygenase [Rhabdonatronobacter sediminivivens]NYS23368.1 antibiotic biosynthesis monooxygenase [Rhabdonatronobacter sediminivivens]